MGRQAVNGWLDFVTEHASTPQRSKERTSTGFLVWHILLDQALPYRGIVEAADFQLKLLSMPALPPLEQHRFSV